MKKILTNILYVSILISLLLHHQTHAVKNQSGDKMDNNIGNITVKDIDGKEVNLSDYNGKVLLIVNVASYCGFTRQYSGLEEIYKKYKDKGFEILAFPCNQFKNQEPGTNEEIKSFCSSKFNVTFKLFDKIDVNGKDQSPLYSVLTNNKVTGSAEINWNFEKFLIDKNGNVVSRYLSKVEPESEELTTAIESELQK